MCNPFGMVGGTVWRDFNQWIIMNWMITLYDGCFLIFVIFLDSLSQNLVAAATFVGIIAV